jgi:restriction endonuclease S subunit
LLQNYRVGNFYNKGNSLKEYVFYLLQSDYIQKTISKLVNEAAQPNLGKGDFDKFIVPPPAPSRTNRNSHLIKRYRRFNKQP